MATKLEKQEYLAEVLWRCLQKEPKLTLKEVAIVIAEQIGDIEGFLKEYKKQKIK